MAKQKNIPKEPKPGFQPEVSAETPADAGQEWKTDAQLHPKPEASGKASKKTGGSDK